MKWVEVYKNKIVTVKNKNWRKNKKRIVTIDKNLDNEITPMRFEKNYKWELLKQPL